MSDEFDGSLNEISAGHASPVYLLSGDEFLVRQAEGRLLAKLAPKAQSGVDVVRLDAAGPREIASELATVSMFGDRKLVVVRDPEFLAPKKGRTEGLSKAREAWKANRKKEGARRVLSLVARVGWGVDDINPSKRGAPKAKDWLKELEIELGEADVEFLKEVATYCKDEGLKAESRDDSALSKWLETVQGDRSVLVISASAIDAKNAWIKQLIAQYPACHFEFKVSSRLKEVDLTEFAASTLAPFNKKMGPGALELLKDRLGGNFRLVDSELTKLALYVETPVISEKDVALLVARVREDEFFELTEAIQKRDLSKCLQCVQDATAQEKHPLMLLGSIAGVVRSLLSNFERLSSMSDGKAPRDYRDFQTRIWPKIEDECKATKTKLPHPYAAFMGMQSAASFGRPLLLDVLLACAEADLSLKLGGDVLLIERLLWTLCGKAAAPRSNVHLIRREMER